MFLPTYPFRCPNCGYQTEVFEHHYDDLEPPGCEECGNTGMNRVYTSFSTGSSSQDTSSESLPGSMNKQDPRDMARSISRRYQSMGQDPGRAFNEAVDRIEKGENPDKVQDFVKEAKAEEKQSEGD